jgi:hypothetical protein
MTKNLEKYVNYRASVTLAIIVLFFGITMRTGEKAQPAADSDSSPSTLWSRTEIEIGKAKERVLAKYESVRFVYRLAVQLQELHARETALERRQKAILRSACGKMKTAPNRVDDRS